MLGLFIWCFFNGFGAEVVQLFESIHPSGFSILSGELSTGGRLLAVGINTLYVIVDSFILGAAFSGLYNFLITRAEKNTGK
jgi:hypothetical protein